MPKLDLAAIVVAHGSGYPTPYDAPCLGRSFQRLGLAAGLTQFGVNRIALAPGAWSSQRHWHAVEDEFVVVLSGACVLVEDGGETPLGPGDCAAFKGGTRDGHHLQNRSDAPCVLLAIGGRDDADWGEYPDIDLKFGQGRYSGRGGYSPKSDPPAE